MTLPLVAVAVAAASPSPKPELPPTTPVLPSLYPDASMVPGGEVLAGLLRGTMYVGLLAAIATVVVGAATWYAAAHNGNYGGVAWGRRAVGAGLVAAGLIGGARVLVIFFYGLGASAGAR